MEMTTIISQFSERKPIPEITLAYMRGLLQRMKAQAEAADYMIGWHEARMQGARPDEMAWHQASAGLKAEERDLLMNLYVELSKVHKDLRQSLQR
jgi:hypothetical protein